jgi:transcriptional regulator with XRE-family HTH domain
VDRIIRKTIKRGNRKLIEHSVVDRINELLEYNHWTPYRLAKESGIPYSSLNNLLKFKNCPTIPTLEKICNGFHITLTEFFNFTENPLIDSRLSETEQHVINAFKNLSSKEKEAILICLNGLCHK